MEQEKNEKVYYQMGLFSDGSEVAALRDECSTFRNGLNNLRKGLFKRFDELSKMVMKLITRQDDHHAEIARMQARIEKLEADLYNSKNNHTSRMVHIVGRKKDVKPLYMWGR